TAKAIPENDDPVGASADQAAISVCWKERDISEVATGVVGIHVDVVVGIDSQLLVVPALADRKARVLVIGEPRVVGTVSDAGKPEVDQRIGAEFPIGACQCAEILVEDLNLAV